MDVLLLGPIEIRSGNGPVSLGARKQRALLAMLALELDRTVSTDRLIDGLWGELVPPSAPKLIQHYVSRLRRSLHGNGAAIVTRAHGYELRLADGDVDAVRFEHLVKQGRPRDALALWRGPPLADVADEPFAAPEIRRLEEQRVRAAELAIDADIAAGRHEDVIAELDALIADHPLRERLQAQLMLALYRAGRQAEALGVYRRARARLVEEIGVEPGPELRDLHAAVLAQDPALAPAGGAAEPRPVEALPQTRPRRLVLAVALTVLAAVAAAAALLRGPDGLERIGENAVGVIEPGSGTVTGQYPAGRGATAITGGGGSLWIANTLDGTVTRIDRATDRVVTIAVGGRPAAVAFGAGSLWVADSDARSVAQIDPGSNAVEQRLDVGNAPRGLAVVDGTLWVLSGDAAIERLDLGRARVTQTVRLAAKPTAIAASAGSLWVASEEGGTVWRIDPRTGTALRSIRVGNGPSAIAAGAGAVWVVNRHDGTLSRIDAATGTVSWTVPVGTDPAAVAAGAGAVWVAGGEDAAVARVDPHRPRVAERIRLGTPATAIATAGGRVWTTTGAASAAHRGGTLRVLLADDPHDAAPIDWLTDAGYQPLTFQLTSLAFDGLVTYRRVDGAAGATLAGGLATEVPEPSADGRAYVFTLRPGVRYADGRAVQPDDFRNSLERFLRVTGDRFPPFYDSIAGARRCRELPRRCDLSAGIRTDRRARTVTIHLVRPDAELLHKLTLPFAFVVPPDTPLRTVGDEPPPGTGPYRFADWDADRGGTLVRNAHFRPSPHGRPAGFADRIEVAVLPSRAIERAIGDVTAGAGDVTVLASPFAAAVRRERLAPLTAQAPGQLHSGSAATVEYMFLNVARPPFDDIRVRRALNDAVDRARVVDLVGGPELATPSCQIVPVGFPGYEPYCPYGSRAGPDPERARRLVVAAGAAGERVVVSVPEFRARLGRYFVAVLKQLGLRASLRVREIGDHFAAVNDPRSRVQIGYFNWSPDYFGPSSYIEPNFACASNPSHLCDGRLTRLTARARAVSGAEALGLWAAADRRIVDVAAAVPLTNRRALVLVSKRVGNVQHHPQWSTLLDQLWVR
jgi:YVTN family beta-propeller protein